MPPLASIATLSVASVSEEDPAKLLEEAEMPLEQLMGRYGGHRSAVRRKIARLSTGMVLWASAILT